MPSECIAPWSPAGLLTCSNTATPPPECTCFDLPAAAAQVLAGGSAGIAALQSLTGLTVVPPLVALNIDPSDGAANGSGVARVLTDEQEALLGCGPFFGTDCDATGIDLLAASASVLMQSFQGVRVPGVVQVPGSRGPGDPAYNPAVDGCVGSGPGCPAASAIGYPLGSSSVFQSEMAALSFNMQMLLVAFSANAGDPEIEPTELDPGDPFGSTPGQCSFRQPQFCSNVIALLPEPEASLGAWVAMGVTVSLAARRKRAAR